MNTDVKEVLVTGNVRFENLKVNLSGDTIASAKSKVLSLLGGRVSDISKLVVSIVNNSGKTINTVDTFLEFFGIEEDQLVAKPVQEAQPDNLLIDRDTSSNEPEDVFAVMQDVLDTAEVKHVEPEVKHVVKEEIQTITKNEVVTFVTFSKVKEIELLKANFSMDDLVYTYDIETNKTGVVSRDDSANKVVSVETILAAMSVDWAKFEGTAIFNVNTGSEVVGVYVSTPAQLSKVICHLDTNVSDGHINATVSDLELALNHLIANLKNVEVRKVCPYTGCITLGDVSYTLGSYEVTVSDAEGITSKISYSDFIALIQVEMAKVGTDELVHFSGVLQYKKHEGVEYVFGLHAMTSMVEWYSLAVEEHINDWYRKQGSRVEAITNKIQAVIDNSKNEIKAVTGSLDILIEQLDKLASMHKAELASNEEVNNTTEMEEIEPVSLEARIELLNESRAKKFKSFMKKDIKALERLAKNYEIMDIDTVKGYDGDYHEWLAYLLANANVDMRLIRTSFTKNASKKALAEIFKYLGKKPSADMVEEIKSGKGISPESILYSVCYGLDKEITKIEFESLLTDVRELLDTYGTAGLEEFIFESAGLKIADFMEESIFKNDVELDSMGLIVFLLKLNLVLEKDSSATLTILELLNSAIMEEDVEEDEENLEDEITEDDELDD